ncbi:hypothetical protein AB0G35_24145 [Streptomyces sp. NPDC021749]
MKKDRSTDKPVSRVRINLGERTSPADKPEKPVSRVRINLRGKS